MWKDNLMHCTQITDMWWCHPTYYFPDWYGQHDIAHNSSHADIQITLGDFSTN